MGLTSGSRLGPYEIVSVLGTGGMGEVYRAVDVTLKRQVAIKVLPSSVSNDAERVSRLRREAELLAAINHPNVAHIYGLQETGDGFALIMELVEGPTLGDRLAAGPLPVDETLGIARQIAAALESAHDRGIIHRDLKPANIKVRDDGTVKVLDFGLARPTARIDALSPGSSKSPTITSPAITESGVILGTAAYMSPEQARGRAVDERTDIWAFGAVLFEMLTGTRAFAAENVTDTLAAIIRGEPDWSLLPASLSPTLVIFLRRSLHKDAAQRIGHIRDLRLALEGAFDTVPAASVPPPTRGASLPWLVAAAALVALAALAPIALQHWREASPPESRLAMTTPSTRDPFSFAVSPDGRQVAYVADANGTSQLWVRSFHATEPRPLAGTDGASYPFWSPDSRSLAFFVSGALKRVDLDGGLPRTLAAARDGRGGTWNADGTILFAPHTGSTLQRISAAGGDAADVTTHDRQVSHRFPVFLEDGRRFLFYASGETEATGIYLGSLDGGSPVRLTASETAATYVKGWVLWVRGGTLVAQRLNADNRTLIGEQAVLADGVDVNLSFYGAVSASSAGPIAYRSRGSSGPREVRWVDRSGAVISKVGDVDDTYSNPAIAPDGKRVAVTRMVNGNNDVWQFDGARATRLTFDPSRDEYATWSNDGKRIVYSSLRQGVYQMHVKAADSVNEETLLDSGVVNDWSADDAFLLFTRNDAQSDRDLWVMPMDGSRKPWLFLQTPFREYSARFSPDGRWIAYTSNMSGRLEIYALPFDPDSPSPSGPVQVSVAGGRNPVWSADGRELFFVALDGPMMAVTIPHRANRLEPSAPAPLFSIQMAGDGEQPAYDVAPDGRFVMVVPAGESVPPPVTLIQNWVR